jgi:hypothetical protein
MNVEEGIGEGREREEREREREREKQGECKSVWVHQTEGMDACEGNAPSYCATQGGKFEVSAGRVQKLRVMQKHKRRVVNDDRHKVRKDRAQTPRQAPISAHVNHRSLGKMENERESRADSPSYSSTFLFGGEKMECGGLTALDVSKLRVKCWELRAVLAKLLLLPHLPSLLPPHIHPARHESAKLRIQVPWSQISMKPTSYSARPSVSLIISLNPKP